MTIDETVVRMAVDTYASLNAEERIAFRVIVEHIPVSGDTPRRGRGRPKGSKRKQEPNRAMKDAAEDMARDARGGASD